jgi:hypothetical protein
MEFNKELWKVNLLSASSISKNVQNEIKLMAVDVIGVGNISSLEITLIEREGRNGDVTLLGYVTMVNSAPFYTYTFTPTFINTKDNIILKVRKIDTEGNYEVLDEIPLGVK